MASLYRHLQAGEADHDRLPFRPDCARCEHRLYGRYPDKRLLSRRQQALAATGLVAASSLFPSATALAGGDDRPGVPTPSSPPAVVTDGGDGSDDGDDGDGGQNLPPLSGGNGGGGGGNGGGGGGHGNGNGGDGGSGGEAPAPPAPEIPQLRPQVEVQVQEPKPPQRPRPHSPRPAPERAPKPQPEQRGERGGGDATKPDRAAKSPSQQGAASVEDATRDTSAARSEEGSSARERTQRPERSTPKQGASSDRAPADSPSGVHVVTEGESLWSIAERKLGAQATNTAVASYVGQLWRLNAERIGTGNPSLIYSGQHLRMPAS